MRKGPRIKVEIRPFADNVIQFHDTLKGAALALTQIAESALSDGDHEKFKGTHITVEADNDDGFDVGDIYIGE